MTVYMFTDNNTGVARLSAARSGILEDEDYYNKLSPISQGNMTRNYFFYV